MQGKTHMIGGVAAAVLVSAGGLYKPETMGELVQWSGTFLIPTIMGSLFLDIDHGNSKASNVNIFTKILSIFIRIIFGHRNLFHSPVFVLGIGVLFWGSYELFPYIYLQQVMVGFIIGCVSHLILDYVTPAGIPLFYPFSKKKQHFIGIKEGGLGEFSISIILMVFTVLVGYVQFFNI